MSAKEREVKIKWFQNRTGASLEEAKKFLGDAGWKIDKAIANRIQFYQSKNGIIPKTLNLL